MLDPLPPHLLIGSLLQSRPPLAPWQFGVAPLSHTRHKAWRRMSSTECAVLPRHPWKDGVSWRDTLLRHRASMDGFTLRRTSVRKRRRKRACERPEVAGDVKRGRRRHQHRTAGERKGLRSIGRQRKKERGGGNNIFMFLRQRLSYGDAAREYCIALLHLYDDLLLFLPPPLGQLGRYKRNCPRQSEEEGREGECLHFRVRARN